MRCEPFTQRCFCLIVLILGVAGALMVMPGCESTGNKGAATTRHASDDDESSGWGPASVNHK
jgi:hypothetical protein